MPIDYGLRVYGKGVYGEYLYGGENIGDEVQGGKSGKRYSEQWETCARCGFNYPQSQLIRQRGDGGMVTVCTVIPCYDEPSSGDYRRETDLPVEPPLNIVED
ncbi:hypothetical protein A2Z56_00135 [Candidatus Kaiserbacteria bacterium RIFCSPHIGHO2_12_45_16]|nr:MAG: hypothetical protein A2Z56_00135 [Candidatus Kaiserbacteria bacterium RIFCSPHIGHO2_12_45_16]